MKNAGQFDKYDQLMNEIKNMPENVVQIYKAVSYTHLKEGEIMEKKILDCIHQFIDQKAFDKCTCIEISQQ